MNLSSACRDAAVGVGEFALRLWACCALGRGVRYEPDAVATASRKSSRTRSSPVLDRIAKGDLGGGRFFFPRLLRRRTMIAERQGNHQQQQHHRDECAPDSVGM